MMSEFDGDVHFDLDDMLDSSDRVSQPRLIRPSDLRFGILVHKFGNYTGVHDRILEGPDGQKLLFMRRAEAEHHIRTLPQDNDLVQYAVVTLNRNGKELR